MSKPVIVDVNPGEDKVALLNPLSGELAIHSAEVCPHFRASVIRAAIDAGIIEDFK